jgi:hypothetical protein
MGETGFGWPGGWLAGWLAAGVSPVLHICLGCLLKPHA